MSRCGPGVLTWLAFLLLAGCTTSGIRVGFNGTGLRAPSHYAQSADSATNGCLRNPACYTQRGDEAIIPWMNRAADAARTTATLMEFLSAADVKLVEQVLVECAKDAEVQVNEEEFGKGNSPTKEQCNEVVRQERGEDVTRAMELGTKKHKVAADCVKNNLGEQLSRNVTVGPRYKYDPASKRWRMLDPAVVAKWVEDKLFDLLLGTLAPDIVIHESGNPNKVQRIYDYKFPCLPSRKHGSGWRYSSRSQPDQGDKYRLALGGEEEPFFITPQLGLQQ